MPISRGFSCTNNMPRNCGRSRTNMSPWDLRRGLSASQTWNTCLTFLPEPLPSTISSLSIGNDARSSMGPDCARAKPVASVNSAARASQTCRAGSMGSRRFLMAVIVPEFHPACKIEARDDHALGARRVRGGTEAEAAHDDAVNRAALAERFDPLLAERINRALVVAQRCVDALLALEQQRDVGAQRLARLSLAHAGDAENQADTPALAAQRTADDDAHAAGLAVVPRRPRRALALH